jgi:ribonuclease BN (tRNA processing enzyme)
MIPDIGETVSFVIDLDSGERILVDCGVNLVRSLATANIDPTTITHLIITHSHGDHISGLPTYLFYRLMHAKGILKKDGGELKIVSTAVTLDAVKNYVRSAYGKIPENPSLNYVTIGEGDSYQIGNSTFSFFPTKHIPVTIGFSSFICNKKIVYSADTAFSEDVLSNAADADILIHDIAATGEYQMLAGGHTLCNQISGHLEKLKIKTIVPVHRLSIYDENNTEYLSELTEFYSGEVLLPFDGTVIEI